MATDNRFNIGPVETKTPFAATPVGIGVNTVLEIPGAFRKAGEGLFNFGRDVIRGIFRSVAKTGLSVLQAANEKTFKSKRFDEELSFDPSKDFFGRILFGEKPLEPLANEIAKNELTIKDSPFAKKYGLDRFALPLAFAGSIVGTALDITPFGGEKNLVKQLVKETDEKIIANILRKIKVSDDIIEKVAPQIAKITDEKEIGAIVKIIKGTEGLKESAIRASIAVADDIPLALRPLAIESTKYQTADEFVSKIADDLLDRKSNLEKLRAGNIGDARIASAVETLNSKLKELETVSRNELTDIFTRAAQKRNEILEQAPKMSDELFNRQEILDTQLESMKFVDNGAEKRYENFKKLYPKFKEVEDGQQFLDKINKGKSKFVGRGDDDILYSQEYSPNEIFDLFKDRYESEKLLKQEIQQFKSAVSGAGENIPAKIGKQAEETLPSKPPETRTPIDFVEDLPSDEQAALKPILQGSVRTVKEKVHALDYFATPEFVLERIGLGKEAKLLHEAYDGYRKEIKVQIQKLIDWKKEVDDIPDSSKQIFKFLDGQSVELSPQELRVAGEMKQYLKEWADRLKLPEDKRIASYITHIFEKDFIQKEFDPDLAKLIVDKVPGSVYDPFLEKRLGKKGFKEDVFAALDAYVKRATRKANMDPALEALKGAAKSLDVESYQYIQRLASRINLRPTELDNLIDNFIKSTVGYKFGVRPITAITNGLRQMIYRGTLGLNLGSALRNLTQGVNTYSKLGEKYSIVGYSKLFGRMITNNLNELYDVGVLDDALVQDRHLGVYKSLLQKMDTGLFKFFDLAEKVNRGAAYFGAKSKAIAGGVGEKEAVDYAKRIVRETQFAFGNVDSPVVMSSDLAKTILQLQTYNVKQIEFLGRMIKNKEFGGLVRWGIGSMAMLYSLGRLFGMKPEQLIPTVRLEGSPLGNALGTLAGLISPNKQKREEAKADIGRNVATMFPAGVQIKKTIEGIRAFNKGKDTTPTGRLRFKIPKTTENFLRASLFGKSSLPEAQEYYERFRSGTPAKKQPVGNRFNR